MAKSDKQHKKPAAIVVGGGWAGLSAAVELVRRDVPVTLLESAKQLGGRARRVPFDPRDNNENQSTESVEQANREKQPIDNGQHLLIGAYESTLSMLRTVGIKEEDVLRRKSLSLDMACLGSRNVKIKTNSLPAPLHLAWGLTFAKGLSLKHRLRALLFSRQMMKMDFTLPADESCLSLLQRFKQPQRLIKAFWEPLCLAALNTHIDRASAQVFLRTLREAFNHSRPDSDFLYTITDLGQTFPDPALDFIEKNGGSVQLAKRVTSLKSENGQIKGVCLGDQTLECDQVVLATPFYTTQKLISPLQELNDLSDKLAQLETTPICTVYLQYPENVSLGREMRGMVGTTSQWLMDRVYCGQPGMISVIISGSGPHMDMDSESLCDKVESEISRFYPDFPPARYRMLIREKRATFHCVVDSHSYRPGNKTNINGLWLAGDYTDTHLPATLEGAVRSGLRSAHGIIDNLHQ